MAPARDAVEVCVSRTSGLFRLLAALLSSGSHFDLFSWLHGSDLHTLLREDEIGEACSVHWVHEGC
jgi:hypothetical protein